MYLSPDRCSVRGLRELCTMENINYLGLNKRQMCEQLNARESARARDTFNRHMAFCDTHGATLRKGFDHRIEGAREAAQCVSEAHAREFKRNHTAPEPLRITRTTPQIVYRGNFVFEIV